MHIKLKRVYDTPESNDGQRVLVDRLWPRGLTKAKARIDVWMKSIAPSNDLRRWIHQDRERWPEFESRYFAELDANSEAVEQLRDYLSCGNTVLL